MPSLENANANSVPYNGDFPVPTAPVSKVLISGEPTLIVPRESPVQPIPIQVEKLREPHVSDIRRQRAEMLATYEASSSLPFLVFAKLAGKSRDQVNRDINARRLLFLSLSLSLGMGIKVATLPVIALGVGIGVDYAPQERTLQCCLVMFRA